MKEKALLFYANNQYIENLLNNFKQSKNYNRFVEVLKLIGDFNNKIEVFEEKDNNNIKLWFSDNDFNLYIINLISEEKKDLTYIKKISNNEEVVYDLSLAKKFTLNKDNINLLKTDKIYNTKFGRLITDNKSFYSLFLGNNTCYQIEIGFNSENYIEISDIISLINNKDNIPSFTDFVKIFENLLSVSNNYNFVNLYAYKDFQKIGDLKIENKMKQKIR